MAETGRPAAQGESTDIQYFNAPYLGPLAGGGESAEAPRTAMRGGSPPFVVQLGPDTTWTCTDSGGTIRVTLPDDGERTSPVAVRLKCTAGLKRALEKAEKESLSKDAILVEEAKEMLTLRERLCKADEEKAHLREQNKELAAKITVCRAFDPLTASEGRG